PVNCPIDCGATCEADERRCDAEVLEVCNLQGRWERLPCPQGEVCLFEEGGSASCQRDPGIIAGGDAGVGEGDAGVGDGRLLPGDGEWPEETSAPTPTDTFPRRLQAHDIDIRLDDGSIHNRPTPFAQLMNFAGARYLWQWRVMPGEPLVLEGFGRATTLRIDAEGGTLNVPRVDYPPATPESFCAAWGACYGAVPPEQCAATMAPYLDARFVDPDWLVACLAANGAENCNLFQLFSPTCIENAHHPLPAGADGVVNSALLVGDKLLRATPEQRHLELIDLTAGTLATHEPVGDFTLPGYEGTKALSADGRVVLALGNAVNDSILVRWDVVTGERRAILPSSGGTYYKMALSPDGQVAAFAYSGPDADANQMISLWNLAEERRIVSIRPPPEQAGQQGLAALAISPDGELLAVDVDGQRAIEVWRLGARPEKLQVLTPGNNARVSRIEFAPDGRTLAVLAGVGFTPQISLWDAVDGQRWRTEDARQGEVREMRFSADGRRLVTMTQDGSLAFYFRVFQP
ncbi:MAG: WD40 repeat domain-containing protein, partial [Myxococcales bacterium]|nr:WD40 repeat domain-containing protein [Myxococcales bacterium]